MVALERSTVMARTMGGLLAGSIATTWAILAYVWSFSEKDRLADEARYASIQAGNQAVRDDVAAVALSVAVQGAHIAGIESEQTDVRLELREIRENIRALSGAKGNGEK